MDTFRYTWTRYQTVDRDGSIYEHELKPKRNKHTWHSAGAMQRIGSLDSPDLDAEWENMIFTHCEFPSDLPVDA